MDHGQDDYYGEPRYTGSGAATAAGSADDDNEYAHDEIQDSNELQYVPDLASDLERFLTYQQEDGAQINVVEAVLLLEQTIRNNFEIQTRLLETQTKLLEQLTARALAQPRQQQPAQVAVQQQQPPVAKQRRDESGMVVPPGTRPAYPPGMAQASAAAVPPSKGQPVTYERRPRA